MRCGNAVRWKAMPSHLTWITLRVIHITTTTAATDSLRIPKSKTKERSILQKVLDTTDFSAFHRRRIFGRKFDYGGVKNLAFSVKASPLNFGPSMIVGDVVSG